ncbi:hypothetical protein BD310DRAFT_919847 [Dichomitus squalens]|uniref:Uncharacterized protein n=1 Tax=Dichomitus squalens TaxID=114155 RepID=A0A4Q9Q571_9APHY|nr:hypothetical protein BD310DRAFT_919847 [Dichomitus squalens]
MARYQPHLLCPLFSKGSVYVEDEGFPRRLTVPLRHFVRGDECYRRSRGFEGELVG